MHETDAVLGGCLGPPLPGWEDGIQTGPGNKSPQGRGPVPPHLKTFRATCYLFFRIWKGRICSPAPATV